MSKPKRLTLDNLNGGQAPALFDLGLRRILENFEDDSTKPTATRTLTLKFTLKADEDRHLTGIKVGMTTSLAQVEPKTGVAYLSMDHEGEALMLVTSDPKQMELADQLSVITGGKAAGEKN